MKTLLSLKFLMSKVCEKNPNRFNSQLNPINSFTNVSDLDFKKEVDRRRSFIDNNWCNEHVDYEDLALIGFFFFKHPDMVQCYFCKEKVSEFGPRDNVLDEHLKYSPNCPLLIRRRTDNEPIDSEKLNRALPPLSYDECGTGIKSFDEDLAYPEYKLTSDRIRTFKQWPVGLKQRPEDLCEAGFVYSGKSDFVVCFSCGLQVGKWDADDNPWVEHKNLLEKDCNYLQLNKDKLEFNQKKYEQEIAQSALASTSKAEASESSSRTHDNCLQGKEIDDESSCKICFENKASIVFLPCKHVAVCGQCIYGIKGKCPICRAEIIESFQLYYS